MGRELWFPGDLVTPFEENILDVVLDGEAASELVIVPLKIDTGVVRACPILVDFIVFDEDVMKVVGVAFADVFDAKTIHYKAEWDGTPLVTPEGGGSGALVVSVGVGALFEELVGEHAQLRKAINSAAYF